jgi:hypothetical protein
MMQVLLDAMWARQTTQLLRWWDRNARGRIRAIAGPAVLGVVLGVALPGQGEFATGDSATVGNQAESVPQAAGGTQWIPQRYDVYPIAWGLHILVLNGCIIDGGAYPSGAPNSENECRICRPATNLFDWTAAPPRTACDAGGVCGVAGDCISSDAPGLVEEFTGIPWEVANVETVTCSDGSRETYDLQGTLTFTSPGPNRLASFSPLGCVFDFNVRVGTATLSNGPVTCIDPAREVTVNAYRVTASQGGLLVSSQSSESFSDGTTCDVTANGTATR